MGVAGVGSRLADADVAELDGIGRELRNDAATV